MAKRLDNYYLGRAIRQMAQYFNLTTPREISADIAFRQIEGFTNIYPNERLAPDPTTVLLVDILINTANGAFPMIDNTGGGKDILTILSQHSTSTEGIQVIGGSNALRRFLETFVIFTGAPLASEEQRRFAVANIADMLGVGTGQGNEYLKKLSTIQVNTPKIMPSSKYTEACTVFLNGFPSLEMARAVPFIDVQFLFGREALDEGNRLNAVSIFKFLEGAVQATNESALSVMVRANQLSGSIAGSINTSGYLSTAGMELFTSPLTMVNGNTSNPTYGQTNSDNVLRTVPVIDKFRPFLSFKGLTVNVQPSGFALISFKTAKMEFVLHDRSRMHEIADFIRPDLYGSTELMLEYGWSHPDPASVQNPYADLLNASRVREKYGIRNASFSATESGEVSITLDLFMKGSDDIQNYIVATASGETMRSLQRVQRLSETIRNLRSRLPANNSNNGSGGSSRGSREVRGIQVLDAAGDAQAGIRLTPEILGHLRQFRQGTEQANNANIQGLREALRRLYSAETAPSQRERSERRRSLAGRGEVGRLGVSIQREIQAKLERLKTTVDPFLPDLRLPDRQGNLRMVSGRTVRRAANTTRARQAEQDGATARRTRTTPGGTTPTTRRTRRNSSGAEVSVEYTQLDLGVYSAAFNNENFSLGKILTLFVGDTLASTGNYEDVQMVFYPFNPYAGFANGLNISQFVVDGRFFIEQFVRFRTETVSRAANLNLKEFMEFIANRIVDDPVAAVYGIDDLYNWTIDRNTGERAYQIAYDAAEYQSRLERRLLSRTPDGTFKMPQISIKLESCPLRKSIEASSDPSRLTEALEEPDFTKTILRVHIFDRQCSQYEGQTNILGAAREESLSSISQIPAVEEGDEHILNEHRGLISTIIQQAGPDGEGIIEAIPADRLLDQNIPIYRITGGPQRVKNFIMKTMPYIIYGVQGTNVKTAQFQSMTVPELSTVNMLRTVRASPIRANGEQPSGLPLTVIPSELNMSVMGCSLIDFGQQFFVDFQSGVNLDNVYVVGGLTHKISQGSFETDIKFTPYDAFGRYESFLARINQFSAHLSDIQGELSTQTSRGGSSVGNPTPSIPRRI